MTHPGAMYELRCTCRPRSGSSNSASTFPFLSVTLLRVALLCIALGAADVGREGVGLGHAGGMAATHYAPQGLHCAQIASLQLRAACAGGHACTAAGCSGLGVHTLALNRFGAVLSLQGCDSPVASPSCQTRRLLPDHLPPAPPSAGAAAVPATATATAACATTFSSELSHDVLARVLVAADTACCFHA